MGCGVGSGVSVSGRSMDTGVGVGEMECVVSEDSVIVG